MKAKQSTAGEIARANRLNDSIRGIVKDVAQRKTAALAALSDGTQALTKALGTNKVWVDTATDPPTLGATVANRDYDDKAMAKVDQLRRAFPQLQITIAIEPGTAGIRRAPSVKSTFDRGTTRAPHVDPSVGHVKTPAEFAIEKAAEAAAKNGETVEGG